MILRLEHWYMGYKQILKDCRTDDSSSVWILCNADADAMASARILCYMLRSDGVQYQLRPCTTISALRKTLGGSDNVKAVVLLNLGASRNLTRLFDDETLKDETKVYVMDCRRPFHLANVHAAENIVLFFDDMGQDEIPSDGDNLSGNESTSSSSSGEDSSDESDGEVEFQDDGEVEFQDNPEQDETQQRNASEIMPPREAGPQDDTDQDYDGEDEREDEDAESSRERVRLTVDASSITSKRRKTRHGGDADQESDSDPQDDETRDTEPPPQPEETTPTQPSLTPRELHRQRRERLRMYYSQGSYYGSPAAYIAYRLSSQLRFVNIGDLLWLACVGVTDAYLHSRIDVAGYATLAQDLVRYCNRIFPNDMYSRVRDAIYAEHLTGGDAARNNLTQISLSESGRILSEKDFNFFLMQHTSLLDSMVHSNYVSTKLQLWNNRGMQRLHELLAKMGYPLDECRQPFAFMNPALRRRLRDKFEAHADEYGLDNFDFTSFKRVTGYQSLLTASDTSYAVTALLECDTPATTSSKARVVSPAPGNEQDDDGKQDSDIIENEEEREAMQAFNIAFDALNPNGTSSVILSSLGGAEGHDLSNLVNGGSVSGNTGIGAGIRLAMSLQRSIISTAVNLVERSAITRLRHFRYAYITCTSDGSHGTRSMANTPNGNDNNTEGEESHVFAKPLALNKLAHYLMDMHRENGKWAGARSRPLVLMAEKPRTATYLVVGYEYPESKGNFTRNRFGDKFELAAKTMKGTFKFDSFDSNVVEVDGNDVQRFIEQLHYMMDSM